jgi:hypothetical protein
MTTFALVEDCELVSMHLPRTGELPDGRKVSGFDKLDEETLKSAGWLPVEQTVPPMYDSGTQILEQSFEVVSDKVVVVYSVVDVPTSDTETEVPQGETVIDRLEKLEAEVKGMKDRASAASVTSGTDAAKIRDAIVNPK